MKSKLKIAIILFQIIISSQIFSQQFDGSSDTTGIIYRTGPIGLGTTNPNAKIHIETPSGNKGIFLTIRREFICFKCPAYCLGCQKRWC